MSSLGSSLSIASIINLSTALDTFPRPCLLSQSQAPVDSLSRFSSHLHLGALFRTARKSQSQTQAEAAASLGVCRQTTSAWERGEIPEDALELVCGYVGEAIANHQLAAASARAESELFKRRWEVMGLQVRAAVGV